MRLIVVKELLVHLSERDGSKECLPHLIGDRIAVRNTFSSPPCNLEGWQRVPIPHWRWSIFRGSQYAEWRGVSLLTSVTSMFAPSPMRYSKHSPLLFHPRGVERSYSILVSQVVLRSV